jgi:tetratricopeptide (TPR) repeat protein
MTSLALFFALLGAGPATAQVSPSIGLATAQVSPSAGAEALFADANAAFLSGDLSRATALYEALLAEGVASPEVETNLGAALQRQGKRGAAALHFERALFLAPSDDDARADLLEIRKANVDRLEGESDDGGAEVLTRLSGPLLGNASAFALLALWMLAWIALGLRLYRPDLLRLAPLGSISAALFAAAAVAALVAAGAAAGHRLGLRRAVVIATSAPAREGPDPRSASPFEVHEATPVRVDDRQNGFVRIRLANGLTGWVAQSAVELVVPPRWGGLPAS